MTRLFEMSERKVKVIPLVIGSLGSILLKLWDILDIMGIPYQVVVIKKSALLDIADILRKILPVLVVA